MSVNSNAFSIMYVSKMGSELRKEETQKKKNARAHIHNYYV